MRAPAADPSLVKACCADLWAHPGVRLLAGDSLHPGGLGLTARALGLMGLPSGALVLDLGCGPGATAEALRTAGYRPVAVDYSRSLAAEAARRAGAPAAAADGERLPFADGSFDGLMAECVLSVIPDVARALHEAVRVLRPGGRVAVSDVTRAGELPSELDTFLSWIACAAGALPADGYREALAAAGVSDPVVEDHSGALAEMIDRARRRLGLLQGSVAAGLVDLSPAGLDPAVVEAGQRLLGRARRAIEEGALGYVLVVGTRAE